MKTGLFILLVLLTILQQPAEAQKGFAVIELFTSEGCSSCPPAERVLEKMADRYANEPVYILEFHVDYWNHLGWKDPYSSKRFTERQTGYTQTLKTQTYTPQVIINGSREFLGIDSIAMRTAIGTAIKQNIKVRMPGCILKRSGQKLILTCQAAPALSGNNIYAALVEKQVKNSVTAGENKGHILQHMNVVRVLDAATVKKSAIRLTLSIPGMPNPDDYEVIVFTQQPGTLQITSAAQVKVK